MKSNKLLYVKNLVFNLPDDFDGNLSDAFQLLIDQRKTEESKLNRQLDSQGAESYNNLDDAIEALWNNDNHSIHIEANVVEIKDNKWVSMLDDDTKLD